MSKEKHYDYEEKILFKISKGEKEEWKEFARFETMSVSQLIRNGVREYIKKIRMRNAEEGTESQMESKFNEFEERFLGEMAVMKALLEDLPRKANPQIINKEKIIKQLLAMIRDGKKTIDTIAEYLGLETLKEQSKIMNLLEQLEDKNKVKLNKTYYELV